MYFVAHQRQSEDLRASLIGQRVREAWVPFALLSSGGGKENPFDPLQNTLHMVIMSKTNLLTSRLTAVMGNFSNNITLCALELRSP